MTVLTVGQIASALDRPGLVHIEVTATDEATARQAADGIAALWASPGAGTLWRVPGEGGVRVRVWADLTPGLPSAWEQT